MVLAFTEAPTVAAAPTADQVRSWSRQAPSPLAASTLGGAIGMAIAIGRTGIVGMVAGGIGNR